MVFQSTLLQEERPIEEFPDNDYEISIHAPTRGATYEKRVDKIEAGFQSTLLQEERRCGKW